MHLYKFDEKKNLIREKTPNWKSIFWDLCDHVVLFLISPALLAGVTFGLLNISLKAIDYQYTQLANVASA